MANDIRDDFVEHDHPQYGGGFFCTADVFERLTAPVATEQAQAVAAVQRIDSIAFTKIAARHLPGDMDPHDAWLFFQEASRAFFGKEIV